MSLKRGGVQEDFVGHRNGGNARRALGGGTESYGIVCPSTQAENSTPIRHLDLRLVHYFLVLAEELQFRRAAARLHLSQPGLSRAIQSLERAIGVELVHRPSQPVSLTIAGQLMVAHGRELLACEFVTLQAVTAAA